MIFHTVVQAVKDALKSQREAASKAAIDSAVKAYLDALPIEKRVEVLAAALPSTAMTDKLLRAFVLACPKDKQVDIVFPGGGTITISGVAKSKDGPGW